MEESNWRALRALRFVPASEKRKLAKLPDLDSDAIEHYTRGACQH